MLTFASSVTFEALSHASLESRGIGSDGSVDVAGSKIIAEAEAPSPVSVVKSPASSRNPPASRPSSASVSAANLNNGNALLPRNEVLNLGAQVGTLCSALLTHAPLDPADRDPLSKGVDETRQYPASLAEGDDVFWSASAASSDSDSNGLTQEQIAGRKEIARSMASVFLALFVAAHACGVNLRTCILKKMELNRKKYPVELCKGKSGKYTEYSTQTGFTSDHRSQSTVGEDGESSPDESTNDGSALTISVLTARIRSFATERSWSRYHTPRNIVLAMMGEVGELAELFQWKGDGGGGAPFGLAGWSEEDVDHVSQELADVSIYLMRLADVCGVDLGGEAMEIAAAPSRY